MDKDESGDIVLKGRITWVLPPCSGPPGLDSSSRFPCMHAVQACFRRFFSVFPPALKNGPPYSLFLFVNIEGPSGKQCRLYSEYWATLFKQTNFIAHAETNFWE